MTIGTVTIGGSSLSVYNSLAEVTAVFNADVFYPVWETYIADTDQALRTLAYASTLVDRHNFTGAKTDKAQTLDWPRDGATCSGVAVPNGTTPDGIFQAHILLVKSLVLNPPDHTISPGGTSATGQIRRTRSGDDEVEFFQDGTAVPVPTTVRTTLEISPHDEAIMLLECYVVQPEAPARAVARGRAFNVCPDEANPFSDADKFNRSTY